LKVAAQLARQSGEEIRLRRLRYCVAASLDGFIAGPNGEYDWIVRDPAIDFGALWAQFDAVMMGRKTFEVASAMRASLSGTSQTWVVVSATLKPEEHPDIQILNGDVIEAVAAMKGEAGKDIWLMGGGVLFRSLLDAGLVDTVEIALQPVMLGSGVPLLLEGERQKLNLSESKTLASGIVQLAYTIRQKPA
jgi:dihydrofolate reductase